MYLLSACNIAGHFLARIEGVNKRGRVRGSKNLRKMFLLTPMPLSFYSFFFFHACTTHFNISWSTVSEEVPERKGSMHHLLRESEGKSVRSLTTDGLNGGATFRSSRFFQLMRSKNLWLRMLGFVPSLYPSLSTGVLSKSCKKHKMKHKWVEKGLTLQE